jgi:hypothetical protein
MAITLTQVIPTYRAILTALVPASLRPRAECLTEHLRTLLSPRSCDCPRRSFQDLTTQYPREPAAQRVGSPRLQYIAIIRVTWIASRPQFAAPKRDQEAAHVAPLFAPTARPADTVGRPLSLSAFVAVKPPFTRHDARADFRKHSISERYQQDEWRSHLSQIYRYIRCSSGV